MPMVTAGPEHVFEAQTEAQAGPFVPFIAPRHYARAPASRRGQLEESDAMSTYRRAARRFSHYCGHRPSGKA